MSCNQVRTMLIAAFSAALVSGSAGRCWSWPWSNEQRKAERDIAGGRFDQALRHYENARLEEPDNPAIEYNIGNVLHRLERLEEASAEYSKVIAKSDPDLKEMASYNMGNNYYVMGDLERAIESYTDALLEDPTDYDAKHNLEMALRRDREQKQNEDKGKEGEQQEKEKREKEREQEEEKEEEKSERPDQEKKEQRPKQGEMSEEEARRILSALAEQEKEERKDLLAGKSSRSAYAEKDW